MSRTDRDPRGDTFAAWVRKFTTKKDRKRETTNKDRRAARHATNKARHTRGDADLPNRTTKHGLYGGGWWH